MMQGLKTDENNPIENDQTASRGAGWAAWETGRWIPGVPPIPVLPAPEAPPIFPSWISPAPVRLGSAVSEFV